MSGYMTSDPFKAMKRLTGKMPYVIARVQLVDQVDIPLTPHFGEDLADHVNVS
jgi:hypothetical protein